MAAVNFASGSVSSFETLLNSYIAYDLTDGRLTPYAYVSGPTAPGPTTGTSGLATIATTPTTNVAIPTTDSATQITATGATSITGGAAGETVIGGNGGFSYTNITPSGSALDYIAAGNGNDLISAPSPGNYLIHTGSGNDKIDTTGSATINAGTGSNTISGASGSHFIYSNGLDAINGSTVAGSLRGTDTVVLVSGQATITPGTSNIIVSAAVGSTESLLMKAGSGSDTVSLGAGGGTVTAGSGGKQYSGQWPGHGDSHPARYREWRSDIRDRRGQGYGLSRRRKRDDQRRWRHSEWRFRGWLHGQ